MPAPISDIRLDVTILDNREVASITATVFLKDRFQDFVNAVNSNGGSYHFERRINWCPILDVDRVTKGLKAAGFTVAGSRELVKAMSALHTTLIDRDREAMEVSDDIDAILAGSGKTLRRYQRAGVRVLASAVEGFALFDDMGLGKTVQTLASLPRNARVVVVGPKSAKGVWRREVSQWRKDLRTTVLSGRGSFRWPEEGEVVVLNYAIMPKADAIPEGVPQGVIVVFDEAQHIRNWKATSTKSAQALADKARTKDGRAYVLTGTPMDNSPFELWTLLSIAGVAKRVFGTWKKFLEIFQGFKTGYGYQFGTPDRDKLQECLRRGSLRRMKESVLEDLPPETLQDIPTEINEALAARCSAAMPRDLVELAKMVNGQQKVGFEKFSKLYEALSSAMIPAMLEIVEQYEDAGVPLVVFSPHRGPIDELAQRPGWAVITGDTTEAQRDDYVRRFQDGEFLGIAGTIAAMGSAVTLTRSSNMLFVNLSFTNGANGQAKDRCRRLGQVNAVNVMRLIADHELARRILEILDEKQALIDSSITVSEITADATPASNLDNLSIVSRLQPRP